MFGMIPFERNNDNFFDIFDNFERKFFGNSSAALPDFRTDIRDAGDKFVLEAELPGFQKEDIKLDLEGDLLTISATHSDESEKKNEGGYLCRERHFGSYSRSFDVSAIQQDKIRASYKDGVLELTLPKKEAAPLPERHAIEIE